jgi:hypothetical protein
VRPPQWVREASAEIETPLAPRYIANAYRDLRKGREDSKDEPGAADFYYGEMEMRRYDKERSLAERAVLSLYWPCPPAVHRHFLYSELADLRVRAVRGQETRLGRARLRPARGVMSPFQRRRRGHRPLLP